MENVKQFWNKVLQFFGKFTKKTLIIFASVAALLIIGSVVLATVLNAKDYEVLFSGVNDTEATAIMSKLQEDGVEYEYRQNGDILVDKSVVEQIRVDLVYEGYPQSGFAYGTYGANAGGLATDSENQQWELYEIQDRIGATIRLFNGVRDAKVNIALADEDAYVLSSEEEERTTASVMLTMEQGYELTPDQAAAVQRLVAKGGIAGMEMSDVAVFDENGIELTSNGNAQTDEEIADQTLRMIETEMQKKIVNILEPFYGSGNIRVSVTGKLNMDKIIREMITYTPNEEDGDSGVISSEATGQSIVDGNVTGSGIAGTETNAEGQQFNGANAAEGQDVLDVEAVREYLVSQMTEQVEVAQGALEDLSISVALNDSGDGVLDQEQLLNLVGNATGIEEDLREDKIAIVSAPFFDSDNETSGDVSGLDGVIKLIQDNLIAFAIGALVILIIIVVLVVLLTKRAKRKKKEAAEAAELAAIEADAEELTPELFNIRNEKSRELRENVRAFTDEHPEIAAQMIRNWLNGGEEA